MCGVGDWGGLGVALDEFDFVTFRSVDEGEDAAGALRGAVAEGVTLGGGVFGEGFEVFYLKGEVGEVGAYGDRAAGRIVGDFDEFFAFGCFEENEFGAARGFVTSDFLKPEDVFVEGDGFLQVFDAVSGVQKFGNHVRKIA